MQTGDRIGLWF